MNIKTTIDTIIIDYNKCLRLFQKMQSIDY